MSVINTFTHLDVSRLCLWFHQICPFSHEKKLLYYCKLFSYKLNSVIFRGDLLFLANYLLDTRSIDKYLQNFKAFSTPMSNELLRESQLDMK